MEAPDTLAERLYAALNEEDISPFLGLCAPDVVVEYPAAGRLAYGGAWRGREGVAGFLEAHEAAEEILAFDPADIVPAGDRALVLGTFEGRARDTGRTWSTSFVHALTFGDDLLVRWQAWFDTAAAIDAHARVDSISRR